MENALWIGWNGRHLYWWGGSRKDGIISTKDGIPTMYFVRGRRRRRRRCEPTGDRCWHYPGWDDRRQTRTGPRSIVHVSSKVRACGKRSSPATTSRRETVAGVATLTVHSRNSFFFHFVPSNVLQPPLFFSLSAVFEDIPYEACCTQRSESITMAAPAYARPIVACVALLRE